MLKTWHLPIFAAQNIEISDHGGLSIQSNRRKMANILGR